MNNLCKTILLAALVMPAASFAEKYTSKYVGEETREIKTLSADDISALKSGGGWGLAKAAELNGYPGPIHLLEMESEIALSSEQKQQVKDLYEQMKAKAVPLGEQLITFEKALNTGFATKDINPKKLKMLIQQVESVRARLRFVHLSAHLETPKILTEKQLDLYNELRGYSSSKDPCKNIPKGHNEKMWKMHNGCK